MLKDRLQQLPKAPGVYFHKDAKGKIIYIGKAVVLRNRVRQYFQKSRARDPKTEALVAEIADVDWIEVETELDALLVEAEMIRRYLPRYNILLRDDKSLSYVRINIKDTHPTVTLTRRPLDDGAQYFGPFLSAHIIKRALRMLRRIFPYSTHVATIPKRACLQYHLGLCPGLEEGKTTLDKYRKDLKMLIRYLKGERVTLIQETEQQMKTAARQQDFEKAAQYRNRLYALQGLRKQIVFSDREFLDMSKDKGLNDLAELLGLLGPPRRIEGYDISHMQGTDTTASMVVFISGMPDKASYRKFKMRAPGNDDFAHMREVLTRRLSERNIKQWGRPDLLLIDGGRGQLSAAISARDHAGFSTPAIGLAKRQEEIIINKSRSNVVLSTSVLHRLGGFAVESADFVNVSLPRNSHVVKMLQRIRDESHRFAVSYHSVLKTKRQTNSLLDGIPTIGPASRKKLLREFGSVRGILRAENDDLRRVVGSRRANVLDQYLRSYRHASSLKH